MNRKALIHVVLLSATAAWAESPYAFRQRLEEVHVRDRRDTALSAAADEFSFTDGCRVPDADFADYLKTSMNVDASVGESEAVRVEIVSGLRDREYAIDVDARGVRISAKDERAMHQAFYHLEDLMNLRKAPFLKFGHERRRMRFSPRMLHSGWGVDVFPDGYLARMAHYGFDAILVFVTGIGRTQGEGARADIPGLIRRARAHGLDTYLYTKIRAFVHPDDPAAAETFAGTYGRLAATYRDAKGIIFVGESCEFPSKDERTTGKSVFEDRPADDKRPDPGWYPCRDYPQWMRAVRAAIRQANPDIEIVYWTYNWGANKSGTEAQRLEVLSQFPEDVVLNFTFFKRGWVTHRNGLRNKCDDYTITFPGPSDFTDAEINFAQKSGRRFYVMSNTGGLTWDFGCAPYEPFPHQWKRRWDGLVAAQDASGLAGLMESHHYGWYPNFVAELAKEAFTEGGMPFETHLRAIAARDFGERNADAVVAIWKDWSEAINDYPATDPNQYGPFRIGPAYPFAFGGPPIAPSLGRASAKTPKDAIPFPGPTNATHKTEWMCNLNYSGEFLDSALSGIACDPALEIPLLQSMADRFARGAEFFERIGAVRDATLGRYLQRTTLTAVNVKRGLRAHLANDRADLLSAAKDEYANAKATLPLLEADSRLGWEPSMGYAGGPEAVRWKLRLMESVYPELAGQSSDVAAAVDPFIGCAWNGHTFPGPSRPFGMVQPGPDTGNHDWQHCSGYVRADTNVFGFSQTHLSGTGCPDMGDVRLLPFVGTLPEDLYGLKDLRGTKDAARERAEVGYYSVALPDLGVSCEITAGRRVAFHRWTCERGGGFHVLIDPQWGLMWLDHRMEDHILSAADRLETDRRTVSGCFRHVGFLPRTLHYRLVFDRPYARVRELPACGGEKAVRRIFDFDLAPGERLEARVAISLTDDAAAERNLRAEAPLGFDDARRICREEWNGLLSRVEVSGGAAGERTAFYTSLYHLCLQPNDVSDAGAVSSRYSGFSLWDTFRAAHPFYTILVPTHVRGMVASLVSSWKRNGFLPVWEAGEGESFCMIGNHAVPVVADAALKGLVPETTLAEAYLAVTNSLTREHSLRGGGLKPKEDWSILNRFGYYPYDLIKGEGVSRTLECAYDDACAARFAHLVGDTSGEVFFSHRAGNWTNVFDRVLGLCRGRNVAGDWREPFDPFRFGGGGDWGEYDCTEGNSWQYTWHVLHEPAALIALSGGKEEFVRRLDSVFRQKMEKDGWAVKDMTGRIGQYVHGNEPSHHIPYLYPFADRPDRTAEIVREVCDRFYLPRTDGLCGNDDCGQMSAWHVFACLGFYPLDPCGGDYVLGAPQLPKVTIALENGKVFKVHARNLSRENKYVGAVFLNGEPYGDRIIRHADIMNGAELTFEMTCSPTQGRSQ